MLFLIKVNKMLNPLRGLIIGYTIYGLDNRPLKVGFGDCSRDSRLVAEVRRLAGIN